MPMSWFGWEGKDLAQIIKIAALVAGGRDELRNNPFIACYAEPISLLHHAGYIESGNTGSLFQLVMCDEIIGMVRRFVRGIKVDEEHLALEVIKDTGPVAPAITQGV